MILYEDAVIDHRMITSVEGLLYGIYLNKRTCSEEMIVFILLAA